VLPPPSGTLLGPHLPVQPVRLAAHLGYITVDSRDSSTLADFWAAALGSDIIYNNADGALLADPSGLPPKLLPNPTTSTLNYAAS
jgi:hypothetical protein